MLSGTYSECNSECTLQVRVLIAFQMGTLSPTCLKFGREDLLNEWCQTLNISP